MSDKPRSLVDIANEAKFDNVHNRMSQVGFLMGSVMSDKYNSIFVTAVGSLPEIEIFAIVDPYDYESCALYKVKRDYLEKHIGGNGVCNPGRGGTNIDKEEPRYQGIEAVNAMEAYARNAKPEQL